MALNADMFVKGALYRVKKSFESGRSKFASGDVVTFKGGGYSHYDNAICYAFESLLDGDDKTWWLHDGQAPELWQDLFEPVLAAF